MTTAVVIPPHNLQNLARNGAPGRIRTCDPRLRRPKNIDHRGEDTSYFDTMSAKAWSCCCGSSTIVIDRRTRSLIVGHPTVLGIAGCSAGSRARGAAAPEFGSPGPW